MNELTPMNFSGIEAVDSRQVAEAIGKEHKNLIRDIRTYCEHLGELRFELTDFFIESTYTSEQNKEMPCYLCTRKGCEMIANKLTGQKGVAFTALYINAFHAMETNIREQDSRKAFTELLQRQSELEKRLEALENNKKLLVQDMQNPVHNFIKECCIMRVSYRDGITTSKLYRAFEMWCRYNTPYAPSKSDFIAGILSYYNTNNKKRIKKKCNGYYYYIITLNPRSIRKLL